jgi:glucosamine-6-phosphate deaminase
MTVIKEFFADKLKVRVFKARKQMGNTAALEVAAKLEELLKAKSEVNMLFAAAPSQNEFLETLVGLETIEWSRVNAFHLDEYIGLPSDAPQGFGNFLHRNIFGELPFKTVNYINGNAESPNEECARYSKLLERHPADIVCMGIGENGHIAFNDPHVAFFNDSALVKVVDLDEKCRTQQVNDGCFARIDDVPQRAITLTIPALMSPAYVYCMVPGKTKEAAVFNTVRGSVDEACPASILRTHDNAILYTDADSAKRIIIRKAVITDEISQDFQEAVDLAVKYDFEAVEIRSVWEKAPHELDDADIKAMKEILGRSALKVCAISSPVFKCDMDNKEEIEQHYEILKKCIKLAKELNADYIRGFTFWQKGGFKSNIDKIAEPFKRAIEILKEENTTMVLEFDPQVNATNARKLAAVLERIDSPYVKALWDPGNDIYDPDGEVPYPDGYRIIRPHMVHMHLKDARKNQSGAVEGVALGTGDVDYIGQFKELLQDGYDGYVALETHYRPNYEISEELMAMPKGSAFSHMGYEATEECMKRWAELMLSVF